MVKFKEGQRVVTNYKSIPNREGVIQTVFAGITASIRDDQGELSHHRLSRLKLTGGIDHDKPDSL